MGKTTVIRLPESMAERLLEIAQRLDDCETFWLREGPNALALEFTEPGSVKHTLDKPVNVASVPQRSPFRYPGGKTWPVPYVRDWLRSKPRPPSRLIEPFAGGAIVSLTVAFERLVKQGENGRGLLSRWYPGTLARRVRAIHREKDRLSFVEGDGFALIAEHRADEDAVFYIDPPYTLAARRLYTKWEVDHARLFDLIRTCKGDFLMSYDNTAEITALVKQHGFETRSVAMKNTHHAKMADALCTCNRATAAPYSWRDNDGTARRLESDRPPARTPTRSGHSPRTKA